MSALAYPCSASADTVGTTSAAGRTAPPRPIRAPQQAAKDGDLTFADIWRGLSDGGVIGLCATLELQVDLK